MLTISDPAFAGPLAGVPLGLDLYHVFEKEIRESTDFVALVDKIG
jgi:betaine reductase